MLLGIDARMWRNSGIGVYLRSLVVAMLTARQDLRVILFGDSALLEQMSGEQCRVVDFPAPLYSWQERRGWPPEAAECDVLFAPHCNAPGYPPRPMVATIHDLIHLLGPGALWGPKRWWSRHLFETTCRNATQIICVSDATRCDLVYHVKAAIRAPEKVTVIHEAASPVFAELCTDEVELPPLPDRHWLAVGIDKPHKRHDWAASLAMKSEIPLVMLGMKEGESFLNRLPVETRRWVVLPGFVTEEQLVAIFRRSLALLMPSVREGFGLPAMEAMAAGCPVLAARAGSLPEVVGEGGLLLPPDDTGVWLAAMRDVQATSTREALINAGKAQAAKFSWERAAVETLSVLERAASGR